jgi:hypothetical protein
MGFTRFGICKNKKCRQVFEKKAPNQLFCPDCSYWKKYEGGSVLKALYSIEDKLQKEADQSGNPKVWTAKEYSQEFLKSLIIQN